MGHLTLGPRLGAWQAPSWSPSWASDRTRPSDRFHDCAYGYEKLRAAVLAPIVLLRRPLADSIAALKVHRTPGPIAQECDWAEYAFPRTRTLGNRVNRGNPPSWWRRIFD
jgi:hypothetical protein